MENLTIDQSLENVGKAAVHLNHFSALLIRLNFSYGRTQLADYKVITMMSLCSKFVNYSIEALELANRNEQMNLDDDLDLLQGIFITLEELKSLDLDKEYTATCLDALFSIVERLKTDFSEWGDL